MALTNIFSINKKKPLMSTVNQSYAASNPVSAFGQKLLSGHGISATQSVVAPRNTVQKSTPTAGPQMSVAPKQIQGSGMGANYASNPTNYVAPKYTPPVYKPALPKTDPTSSFVASASQAAERQKTFAEQQRDQQQDFIKQKYGLANQQLKEALPAAQQQFGQFKANTEASIADLLAGGERQKGQASDYYGDAQRQAAQTLRETQGQSQRTFANLGTLDSRGEGSFAQANENQMSDFNRNTQQILKAKADKLSEIDATVSAAERSARATITQEEAKLNELARNIEYAVANNSLEEAQQLTQAYNETQQYIYDIEDALTQTKYQFSLEQQKLENELAKTQSFTPEFMTTGVPTNQAEYEFIVKNQKDAQSYYGTDGASSGKQEVVSAITDLLNSPGGLSQVTGYGRLNPANYLPESDAGATRAKLDRVKALVSLENASKLKGSGAISDAERALLAAASTAINGNMSPAQVEAELSRIVQQFGGAGTQVQSGIDPAVAAYLQANGL